MAAHRRKTLSQNFLHDRTSIRRFLRAAEVGPDASVLEPGAGEGALTVPLARQVRRVTAYELDPVLAARLSRRLAGEPDVRVVPRDFLHIRPPRQPFAVVGNIPFSRTSAIVQWCLEAPTLTSATLLTQLEFARKHTGAYGRWPLRTVLSWPENRWRLVSRVPRHHFHPAPRTDGAVLRVERRSEPLLPARELASYRAFVTDGFQGRGGSVRATLTPRHGARRVAAALGTVGVPRDAACGLVSPDQWVRLFAAL